MGEADIELARGEIPKKQIGGGTFLTGGEKDSEERKDGSPTEYGMKSRFGMQLGGKN